MVSGAGTEAITLASYNELLSRVEELEQQIEDKGLEITEQRRQRQLVIETLRDQLREKAAFCRLRTIQHEFDADRIDKYLAEPKEWK